MKMTPKTLSLPTWKSTKTVMKKKNTAEEFTSQWSGEIIENKDNNKIKQSFFMKCMDVRLVSNVAAGPPAVCLPNKKVNR